MKISGEKASSGMREDQGEKSQFLAVGVHVFINHQCEDVIDGKIEISGTENQDIHKHELP